MPFLRRRGNMASETDMRRLAMLEKQQQQQLPLQDHETDPDAPPTPSLDIAPPSPAGPADDDDNDALPGPSRPPQSAHHLEVPRPESPPIQEETPKHRRFSVLRFRNASDSQLSLRVKQHAEQPPPLPRPPNIITTAPTVDMDAPPKKPGRIRLAAPFRKSVDAPRLNQADSADSGRGSLRMRRRQTVTNNAASGSKHNTVTFEEPGQPGSALEHGQDGALAPPGRRLSDSSRSDGSFTRHQGDDSVPSLAPQRSHTPSTFFRLTRRKQKPPEPLFPISHLPQRGKAAAPPLRPSASTSSLTVPDPSFPSQNGDGSNPRPSNLSRPPSSHSDADPNTTLPDSFGRTGPSAAAAIFRPGSTHSGQSSPSRTHLRLRGRSSTMSSVGRDSVDDHLAPPSTTRTSTSTGRKSFGDLFGLGRLRQNSDLALGRQGTLTPATPGSSTSKNNSLQLAREPIVLPDRRDDDTPAKYLARLEEVMSRGVIASALSKGTDSFTAAVLRSYMRTFSFFGDPMDMAIRKLLMEAELPKETQQIDRCLQAFANRYHECNPGIYASPDQAYFVAFSLLILHTDVFNKNNKHKMQKPDYLKNTRGEGVFDDILECFYDNIAYTPFIHVEDDLDINGERIVAHKAKRKPLFPGNSTPDSTRRVPKEPLDPYTLIIDSNLDVLRPTLKDVMHLDDHYSYLGTARKFNLKELQQTFFRTGVLQIVSARSRPDAFMSEKTAINPEEAHPGIVDIKITKVGLLWRKDTKKRKTRSPWQEWGAILTGAQLYFFRNTAWVKNLIHQYESHIKQGHEGIPIIFKPPLDQFKPDALMSTDGAVALLDNTYTKHKHAFVYVRHGGFEEVLLADDEEEMNDWLAKLNYAAAFRTSGVRMRGVVGGNYEGQSRRGIRRLDSSDATQSIQTPTGEVTIARGRIDHKMAEDILAARREIMAQKIDDANEKLAAAEKQLEIQLRNARHLQILAPIQAKTRDQLLLSAAKMAAQLKWTRVEIWRLRCHRDILLQDLEEERSMDGRILQPAVEATASSPTDKQQSSSGAAETKSSTSLRLQKTNGSSVALTLSNTMGRPDSGSSANEEFMTPPTSARLAPPHLDRSMNSPEDSSGRKGSVSSSIASSDPAAISTPPSRGMVNADDGTSRSPVNEHQEEVDADERDLLAQVGLLSGRSGHGKERKPANTAEAGEGPDRWDNPTASEKLERTKVRRSLQRTLREGAGHLSHHRSRKGKDSASSGISEETLRDDKLARGTGSFVVHGKKASVINFGSELQSMSRDESLRQRKQVHRDDIAAPPSRSADDVLASSTDPFKNWERRESAASASTATARSFRELHRKYSSAQASRVGGKLTVPSDGDSEAAVSFSDGRRTPLPPIDTDSADEAGDVELSKHNKSPSRVSTPDLLESPISVDEGLGLVGEEESREMALRKGDSATSPPVPVAGA